MQAGKRSRPPGSDSSDEEGMGASQCLDQLRKLLKAGALSPADVQRVLDEIPASGKALASPKAKRAKKQRNMDMSKYRERYIALRMLYFGERLRGFASLNGCADDETAEGLLVGALERTRLISSLRDCAFSRSGRTDKGVSAFGQVVTLRIRSRALAEEPLPPPEKELDYVGLLNRLLPDDVRVTGWADVPLEFSARYSTAYRVYRYYFVRRGIDIDVMAEGARRLIGTHDFRNFCKMDADNVSNFRRTVIKASIHRAVGGDSPWLGVEDTPAEPAACTGVPTSAAGNAESLQTRHEVWFLELVGHAFLWHQVRCIMATLFLVGRGLEPVSVLDEMLDVGTQELGPTDVALVAAGFHGRRRAKTAAKAAAKAATAAAAAGASDGTAAQPGMAAAAAAPAAAAAAAAALASSPDASAIPAGTPGGKYAAFRGRPNYDMAPDLPLVLYHCHYQGLRFWAPPRAARAVQQHLETVWSRRAVAAHQAAAAARLLAREAMPATPTLPFLLRPEQWEPGTYTMPDGSEGEPAEVLDSLLRLRASQANTALARGAAETAGPVDDSAYHRRIPLGKSPTFEEAILWTRTAPPRHQPWCGTAELEAVWLRTIWPVGYAPVEAGSRADAERGSLAGPLLADGNPSAPSAEAAGASAGAAAASSGHAAAAVSPAGVGAAGERDADADADSDDDEPIPPEIGVLSSLARASLPEGSPGAFDIANDSEYIAVGKGRRKGGRAPYLSLEQRGRTATYAQKLVALAPARRRLVVQAHEDILARLPSVLGEVGSAVWLAEAGLDASGAPVASRAEGKAGIESRAAAATSGAARAASR